jgi:hypothetical protein
MGAGKPIQRRPGSASMFPGEAPQVPLRPGMEESTFRRGEITAERDRNGRREEMYRDFQAAEQQQQQMRAQMEAERARATASVAPGGAVERGAQAFGAAFGGAGQGPANIPARSGVAFGPGRTTRTPEPGTPEFNDLIKRGRKAIGRR